MLAGMFCVMAVGSWVYMLFAFGLHDLIEANKTSGVNDAVVGAGNMTRV